jgi:hypothetical protein
VNPLLLIEETLPVDPGKSPFHVRGVYYARVMEHARSSPGGIDAFWGALKDARLKPFLQQSFSWSEWYDAFPTLPAHVALARVRSEDFEKGTRDRARGAAVELVGKLFKFAMDGMARGESVPHIPRIFESQFDFGSIELSATRDRGEGTVRGIPRYVAPSLINVFLGIMQGALEHDGGASVKIEYTSIDTDGSRDGFDLIRAHIESTWTPPAR